MSNLQVFAEPLQLRVGAPALMKISGSIKCVTIVSDKGGIVSFTYPLRPNDKTVHSVPKACVYLPLADLRKEFCLSLTYTANRYLKKEFGYGNLLYESKRNSKD